MHERSLPATGVDSSSLGMLLSAVAICSIGGIVLLIIARRRAAQRV